MEEEIQCNGCGYTFIAENLISPVDFGEIICPACGAAWCWCKIHGRYEAPPPCPEC